MNGASSALVVEDDLELLAVIADELRSQLEIPVLECDTLEAALRQVQQQRLTLIVLDVHLGDGIGHDLVQAALARLPIPAMIAISGKASAEEAFRLAELGVGRYLAKPLSVRALRDAVRGVLTTAPVVAPALAAQVGKLSIYEVKRDIRTVMLKQALALSSGNRSECARLLGVTRQAVQHMLRELEIEQ